MPVQPVGLFSHILLLIMLEIDLEVPIFMIGLAQQELLCQQFKIQLMELELL